MLAALGLTAGATAAVASQQAPARREIKISARKYTFVPSHVEVNEGDVLKITLTTADIPHSLVIDEYRIAKRANPDQPAVFEFRADRTGTFPFYCDLSYDEGCRAMRGQLIVRGRS